MTNKPLRVLIVDDSALIRQILVDQLSEQPGMMVVGRARDGEEGLEAAARLNPDVIVMDVEMPRLNGLETLRKLLPKHPIPVVMFSSLTQTGARTTFEAIELGAMDCVGKPESLQDIAGVCSELAAKIRAVAGADIKALLQRRKSLGNALSGPPTGAPSSRSATLRHELEAADVNKVAVESGLSDRFCRDKLIAVGISTGGPPALASIFRTLAPACPPIVIVQHMPPGFTRSFAERLDRLSKIAVKEAATGDVLIPNTAFVAPGGKHVRIVGRDPNNATLEVFDGPTVSSHRPSVDVMMKSAAEVYKSNVLGVIMTGMGRDGADGCRFIREQGGLTIGQDEATSDVYGMNKIAWNEGALDRQFGLHESREVWFEMVRHLGQRHMAGAH